MLLFPVWSISVTSTISGDFDAGDFGISIFSGMFAGIAGNNGSMYFSNFSKINKTLFIRSGTKALGNVTKAVVRGGAAGFFSGLLKLLN